MLQAYQLNILQLLETMENHIHELYTLFAIKFPGREAFWRSLALDEKQHAAYVRQLIETARSGGIHFDEGKTRTYTVNAMIDYLKGIISKMNNGKITLMNAFALTVDIENALLERAIYRNLKGLSPEAEELVRKLNDTLADHIKVAKKAFHEYKESSLH